MMHILGGSNQADSVSTFLWLDVDWTDGISCLVQRPWSPVGAVPEISILNQHVKIALYSWNNLAESSHHGLFGLNPVIDMTGSQTVHEQPC